MRLGLYSRLLIFSVILAVFPIGLAGVMLLQKTEAALKSAVNDELLQAAQGLADEVDALFLNQWLAPLDVLRGALDDPKVDAGAKLALLERISAAPDLIALQLSVAGGEPVLAAQQRATERLRARGEDPARVLGRPHAELAALNPGARMTPLGARRAPELGAWVLDLAAELARPLGGRQAILLARVDLGRLRERLQRHPFNRTGALALWSRDDGFLFEAGADSPLLQRARESLAAGAGQVGVMPFEAADGAPMLGGYALSERLPWAVLAERAQGTAYLPVAQMRNALLGWMALGVGLAVLAAWLLARRISRPVLLIESVAERVGRGDFAAEVPDLRRRDEIGQLGERMNRMIEGLRDRERVKDVFGRFQSPEVVNTLLETPGALELGGERRALTLMMTDLRGFTALSERLPPEQVVDLLNRYFEPLVEICERYRGTVNEIIGDALFVLFGAPLPSDDHLPRAVACAVALQNAMAEVNADNLAAGRPRLEMGIGINTGEAVVGNVGSARRAKFSVVGKEVNLTGRIEGYTVGGQILVSEPVMQGLAGRLELGQRYQVRPKGVPEAIEIFEVLGIGAPYELRLNRLQQRLGPLQRPLALRVTPLDGKQLTDVELAGRMTAYGEGRARLEVEAGELELLTNLILRIPDPPRADQEAYAKTVAREEGAWTVRFTALSPELEARFNAAGRD